MIGKSAILHFLPEKAEQDGAVLIEAMLALPLILLIILGMIYYSSAFEERANMIYAARAGALAAVLGAGLLGQALLWAAWPALFWTVQAGFRPLKISVFGTRARRWKRFIKNML